AYGGSEPVDPAKGLSVYEVARSGSGVTSWTPVRKLSGTIALAPPLAQSSDDGRFLRLGSGEGALDLANGALVPRAIGAANCGPYRIEPKGSPVRMFDAAGELTATLETAPAREYTFGSSIRDFICSADGKRAISTGQHQLHVRFWD